MREQLFYKRAYDVVKLDSAEVEKTLRLSQREYDLEFYSIHNDSIGKALRARVQAHPDSALAIFNSIMPQGKRPTWTAKWKDPDHINIHEALFFRSARAGQRDRAIAAGLRPMDFYQSGQLARCVAFRRRGGQASEKKKS